MEERRSITRRVMGGKEEYGREELAKEEGANEEEEQKVSAKEDCVRIWSSRR